MTLRVKIVVLPGCFIVILRVNIEYQSCCESLLPGWVVLILKGEDMDITMDNSSNHASL